MGKTKIDWADFTVNPIKGKCPVACPYCYARRLYDRFKWNPEIRFVPEVYDDISVSPRRQRIFVGSTIELFGDWIRQEWLNFIIKKCYVHPWHTFIFLTKQPQNLIKWSPFPENCWVGVSIPRYWDDSVIGHPEAFNRISQLGEVRASVKFVSFEPLLSPIASEFEFGLDMTFKAYGISWVIIGQQTPVRKATMPSRVWIDEIENACKKVGIPYFEKNNLKSLLGRDLIQQFPNREAGVSKS